MCVYKQSVHLSNGYLEILLINFFQKCNTINNMISWKDYLNKVFSIMIPTNCPNYLAWAFSLICQSFAQDKWRCNEELHIVPRFIKKWSKKLVNFLISAFSMTFLPKEYQLLGFFFPHQSVLGLVSIDQLISREEHCSNQG